MTIKPFTPDELAAWMDAQIEAMRSETTGYELKGNEFTIEMYAEAADISVKTAYSRIKQLVDAGRLLVRKETMNGRSKSIYTPPEKEQE